MLKAVSELTRWRSLGLQLGLHYSTLDKIRSQQRDNIDDCKMEMLSAWLRQQDDVFPNKVPSWSVLRAALRAIGENELAFGIVSRVTCMYV